MTNTTKIWIGVGIMAIVAGFLVWWFFFKETEAEKQAAAGVPDSGNTGITYIAIPDVTDDSFVLKLGQKDSATNHPIANMQAKVGTNADGYFGALTESALYAKTKAKTITTGEAKKLV